MSFGGGGGVSGSSTTSTSTSTTPWTTIANQLASTLAGSLKDLGSGSSITQGVQALTASNQLQTKQGIANIKEAEGASGSRFGTSIAQNISQFQTAQSTALGTQIAQFQQQAVSNQLSALQEIISLAAGSGTTSGKSSTFGWQASASFGLGCWIAAAVFDGWDDPRTSLVREWFFTEFVKVWYGRVLMSLYLRYGEVVAHYVKRNRVLKAFFRPWFNLALKHALQNKLR